MVYSCSFTRIGEAETCIVDIFPCWIRVIYQDFTNSPSLPIAKWSHFRNVCQLTWLYCEKSDVSKWFVSWFTSEWTFSFRRYHTFDLSTRPSPKCVYSFPTQSTIWSKMKPNANQRKLENDVLNFHQRLRVNTPLMIQGSYIELLHRGQDSNRAS